MPNLSPALLVCVAYIHFNVRPPYAANVLNALRSNNPNDALLSVYGSLQHGNWAIEYRLQEAIDYIRLSLKNPTIDPTVLVGTVVRLLEPPPTIPEGYIWGRLNDDQPWRLYHLDQRPTNQIAAVLPLGSVYRVDMHGLPYRVVGVEGTTFADFDGSRFDCFDTARNVGRIVVCAARHGFEAARGSAKTQSGAKYGRHLIDRMESVVNG